ncbi:MAG: right-handed parallel beta-helix repeat-containing protein [Promethearchaeota archaeon]
MEKNNILNSGFNGVSILSSADTVLYDNNILNNSMFVPDIPQPSSGVLVSASPRTNITGNIKEKSSDAGIGVESSEYTVIHRNFILRHEMVGVFLGLSPNCQVTNNTYAENGGSTFVEYDQSPNSIIEGNVEVMADGSPLSDGDGDDDNGDSSEVFIAGYNGVGIVLMLPISGYFLFLGQVRKITCKKKMEVNKSWMATR